MERYEAYKDSGVEWIGKIPAGWDVQRIKDSCSVIAGATPKSDKVEYWEGGIPWITPADYGETQHYVDGGSRSITELGLNSCGTTLVPKGSVIVSNRAPIGLVSIASRPLCTNQGCKAVVPLSTDISSEYLYWYLLVQAETLNSLGQGTTFLELSTHALSTFAYPCPSSREQQAIADYLDVKTAEIDALVADCEREVGLLREYRKAVISEAVTKGLDPNVPMRDSGVEWIGEIPDGWDIVPLRRCIVRTGNGITRRGDYDENGTLVLKLRNINNGAIDYGFQNRMQLSKQELKSFKLNVGDFLFVRVNGSRDLVGKSAIFEGFPGSVAYNDHIIRISFSNHYCIPRFILWYLQSEASRREIDLRVKTSAGQFTVSSDDIKECLLVMPPLQEQFDIASFLDDKTAEIDSLIEAKQTMADKLREYRRSLISEAVTGKFKVPGV